MSYLNSLYNLYKDSYEKGLVDNNLDGSILLPIYHSSYQSKNGRDIIKIQIDKNGNFFSANYLSKGEVIVFPVTEDSMTRTSGPVPHPLTDQLSYICKDLEGVKNDLYEAERNKWLEYAASSKSKSIDFLSIIDNYLRKNSILEDILSSLYKGLSPKVSFSKGGDSIKVEYSKFEKNKEIIKVEELIKTYITFELMEYSGFKNVSVTDNIDLHNEYISYVENINKEKDMSICTIANEEMYCVSKHRGAIGSSKLVSISNRGEPYLGRFKSGEEVTTIGYKTSQMCHNMFKFLYENKNSRRWLGDSEYLINWFSSDIGNRENLDVIGEISTEVDEATSFSNDEFNFFDEEDSVLPVDEDNKTLAKYITGAGSIIPADENYYVLIVDKINDGRVSVKYHRVMPKSDLIERARYWHSSCSWSTKNYKLGKIIQKTPSLFSLINACYGIERTGSGEKGLAGMLTLDNDKLKKQEMQRLLPCVIEGKKIPLDLVRRSFYNFCHREKYDKAWNSILFISCALIKKYYMDYCNREVDYMLDKDNLNRSYLFGRLLAIFEKVESETYTKDNERFTNAQRSWARYSKMPAQTSNHLRDKLNPYYQKLNSGNKKWLSDYLGNMELEILGKIDGLGLSLEELDKPLDFNFTLGYASQKNFLKERKIDKVKREAEEE